MTIRSAQIIGDLWPVCENCKHIAQAHDSDGCSETRMGQCPFCNRYDTLITCSCKEYKGPTLTEFMQQYLTKEEAEYFGRMWGK